MHRNRIGFWIIIAVILLMLFVQTALAGSQTIDGITFNGPDTYSQCVDAPTSDTITITGLNGHKPPASVQGGVEAYFIDSGGGRTLLHSYSVDSTHNVNLKVNYPPVSQWHNNNGTREIHVDVSINVIENGKVIGNFGGNPNLSWDVYCTGGTNTPTPTGVTGGHTSTPTATATKVVVGRTPTSTRTATKVVPGGHTPTSTPTATEVVIGGRTPTETPVIVGTGGSPTPTTPSVSTGNQETPTAVSASPVAVANSTTPAKAQGTGPAPSTAPVSGAAGMDPLSLAIILFVGAFLVGTGLLLKRAIR